MAYSYGPPPGFGQQQGYGSYGNGAPQFAPPGAAPGMSPPPGMNQAHSGPPHGGAVNFSQMQLPPGVNFNASVIRMTGSQPASKGGRPGGSFDAPGRDQPAGNRGRTGLGADSGRSTRETNLQPLTKEEVARTIYVGGLVDGVPSDAALEDILNAGRGLRRWSRVTDAEGKACDFGFAEYEDAASLEIAAKLFEDLEVPLKKDGQVVKDEDGEVVKTKLMVIVDPQTDEYIKQWTKGDEDELQFKMESAQDDLRSAIARYINMVNSGEETLAEVPIDGPVDYSAQATEQAELLALPAAADDELADIPADMRETVAAEIAAFRERSNLRDMERLKMEEEVERAEKEKSRGSRINRLASPPVSAPKGPSAAPNGAPVGPRDRHGTSAAGSKAITGLQIPKDYINGVAFVNGDKEDESTLDDVELERKRQKQRDDDLEKEYVEHEKRWMLKEKNHFAAVERQKKDEEHEAALRQRKRDELAERLKDFDESDESQKRKHLFFTDYKEWAYLRKHERHQDDRDRREDDRAAAAAQRRHGDEQRNGNDRHPRRPDAASAPSRDRDDRVSSKQGFSLSLGGFGSSNTGPAEETEDESRRAAAQMAAMENLLADNEDDNVSGERPLLRRFELKPLAPGETMTDAQRQQARSELARSITNEAAELFALEVQWEHLPDRLVREELRPYIASKIQDAVGVQEDMLVASIERIVVKHGTAEEVLRTLVEVVDEDAEDVTKRIWKMVVFYSEAGARGLLG